jgi:trk system potassium uptake protein TrkH
VFVPALMLLMGCFVTCAGSTGGGVKMIRVLLLLKLVRRELVRTVHPNVVNPVVLGGHAVSPRVLQSVIAFMMIYGGTLTTLSMVLVFTGLDLVTAFSAVIACLNNIGPGLGQVGPAGNFSGLTDLQTWVCSFAMLLGRLELLSLLVLFTPQFWRR